MEELRSTEILDKEIKQKIKQGIKEEHSVETWFGDLSKLKEHMDNRE